MFSAAIAATLGIGIGANSAVFSVINSVLLRPLPFADDDRLVVVWEHNSKFGITNSAPAFGNYVDWHAHNRSFSNIGSLERRLFQLTGAEDAEEIAGGVTTPSFLATIGVKPLIGRVFTESEEQPGAERAAILGYELWKRRFGGNIEALSQGIVLDGARYRIVGVMPAGFRIPSRDMEVWLPTGNLYQVAEWSNRDRHNIFVAARLKDGVSLAQAREDLETIATRLQREHPKTNAAVTFGVQPLRDYFAGDVRVLYAILQGAAGVILLIACSNLANLMLSQGSRRTKEAAVALALGGSRLRVSAQFLIESWILGAVGGALGLLIAVLMRDILKLVVPPDMAAISSLVVDFRVAVFTLAVSTVSGVLLGLIPALQTTRLELVPALKEASGRQVGSDRRAQVTRAALVAAQVALSVVLITGCALLLQTFARLRAVPLGFDPSNVLTVKVRLPRASYRDGSHRLAFVRATLERIENLPGVVAAGYTTGVPLALKGSQTGIRVEHLNSGLVPVVNNRSITPDYLRAMGMRLVRGRGVLATDGEDSPRIALVNETMAQTLWPGQNPIGQRFRVGMQSVWIAVAGVVGDVKQAGLDVAAKPEVYLPFAQQPEMSFAVVVRSRNSPMSLVGPVRQVLRDADPNVPITQVTTMDGILDDELYNRRVQTTLMSAFAAVAGIVALVGVYGLIAYLVQQRTRENGIRLALGATPGCILGRTLLHGLAVTLIGVGLGVVAASVATLYLRAFLFGIGPHDPLTFGVVTVAVTIVAVAAALIPAIRASRIDPAHALRFD